MEEDQHKWLRLKIGLTIKRCIDENLEIHKENLRKGIKDSPSLSYTSFELAANTGLRSATISAILNGDSDPYQKTMFDIISAFNLSFSEFASRFDKISEKDLEDYAKQIYNERKKRKRKS